MFSGFDKIVEERIKSAQRKGQFDNLEGSGKLLRLDDDRHIPEELRLAYKMLKNADCAPPEIELKKEILKTETLLSEMTETAAKYKLLQKLNFMIMKLNTFRDTTIDFEMPQHYMDKLAEHVDKKPPQKKKYAKIRGHL